MNRRSFLFGVGASLAAPLVVKAGILMPVKRIVSRGPILIDSKEKLLEYFGKPVTIHWEELGAQLAKAISDQMHREGFMRQILARADVNPDHVPRFKGGTHV